MAKVKAKNTKNPRGVFERPKGSGVWWINYYYKGKQHREKVGRKSDAIDLYQIRKADATLGRKLPELRATKTILFRDLIDDVLEFTADHKDSRSYRTKAKIVGEVFGATEAAEIKPQEIERFLRKRCKTPATSNRYRAFFSLCFRRGITHGKITSNPARSVDRKTEPSGRPDYLTAEEYARLHAVIARRFPDHLAEFVVSVHTGMRLGEQYTCTWSQFKEHEGKIELSETKNGQARTVFLNADAAAAILSVKPAVVKGSTRIFARQGSSDTFDNRSWYAPCLREAGISKKATWHTNRHTFCSWLAMAGASTLDIMHAAGHKHMAMAARYSHLSSAHKASVVDRIAGTGSVKHAPEQAPQHAPENVAAA
jgi:site-specific recombinase XerD